jgi:Mg-chelatase subunit ChlD
VSAASLHFGWPAGVWLALPVALAAALLLRRTGIARSAVLVRAIGVCGLMLALAQPELLRGRGALELVVDDAVAPAAFQAVLPAANPESVTGVLRVGQPYDSLAETLDGAVRALAENGIVNVVTAGDGVDAAALLAARQARAAGLTVNVVEVASPAVVDAAVTKLDAPTRWRAGGRMPVVVHVRASRPAAATVSLRRDGSVQETQPVSFTAGAGSVRFWPEVAQEGPVRWSGEVAMAGDTVADNDRAHGLTWIMPPARVLVVGDGPGAVGLADRLTSAGLGATVLAPGRLPGRLSSLAAWDALVLVDVPAAALGLDQQAAVAAFAETLGRGVVLAAGRQSFLPGGWAGSPLAQMAPVRLDPPPRDQRDEVALVLMIDQSASMGSADGATAVSKLALAREAAALAAETLHAGDRLGVVAYDDAAKWLIPLAQVDGAERPPSLEAALGGLNPGGGTRILSALELALPALAALDVPTRHAVLLTDGRDFSTDLAAYDQAVGRAREAGVTLSTIAVGADADRDLLARLAERGRGRFHQADDPGDLPRLTVQESETLRARSEQRGRFQARVPGSVAAPLLAGVDVAALPPLTGYLATTARPEADVVLETPNGDPLLALWQVGPGRVAAWLSDVGDEWTTDWASSPAAADFWAAMVRHVAPLPDATGLDVVVAPDERAARISVDALDPAGHPIDLAELTLTISDTMGQLNVDVPQTAPGRYGTAIELPAEGAFPAELRMAQAERPLTLGLGLSSAPGRAPLTDAPRRLAALAAAGGGEILTRLPERAGNAYNRQPLGPLLVALLALLWPVDVALQLGLRARSRRRATAGTGL